MYLQQAAVLLFINSVKLIFMSKIISLSIAILFSAISFAQTSEPKPRILYGAITIDSLTVAPYDKWFATGYDIYKPNVETVALLKKQSLKDYSIQIFLGTWCGDSKREVPRFMKLTNEIGIPANNIKIITVGDGDSLYKQSPQHEEKGLGIFRVPAFIIYKNGVEINRINEYPVNSLEKDVLNIINNQPYTPNYRSFSLVTKWLNDGTLLDENISSRSIAGQLKQLVAGENEINSLAYLLLEQNKMKEALKLFQANYNLYPESANIISSLGEGYLKNKDSKNAILYLERALEQNKDPKAIKGILEILYTAKGLK
jgi:thiol-disulfide isomerase/thioredoxin